MASSFPSSTNIASLTPSLTFKTKKSNFFSRRSVSRNLGKLTFPAQKYTIPFSTSIRLFPQFQIGCIAKPKPRIFVASASGTDVALEEADLSPADNETSMGSTDALEISKESSATPESSAVKSKRPRPTRKSEMPPLKNEDLVAGATFTGKVRSIQPFGAFVDFGAFTDGLVHVSQLSDSFVKDVSSVVSVGQEVTVRLVEADLETGRISLSMRSSDDANNGQQQRNSPGGYDKSRPQKTGQKPNQKRDETKKSSKFVKGQDLEGTVKNLTRAGAFISLPEGEEGFLPQSEENDEGFGNIMGVSSLEVGQEVSVRVLRISRGQVTLTMKKDEAVDELDSKLRQGTVHTATNPFVLAFRSSQVISAFLDEREKENKSSGEGKEVAKETDSMVSSTDDKTPESLDKGDPEIIPETETKNYEIEDSKELVASSVILDDGGSSSTEDQIADEPSVIEATENNDEAAVSEEVVDLLSENVEETTEISAPFATEIEDSKEVEASSVILDHGGSSSTEDQIADEPSVTEATENNNDAGVSEEVVDLLSENVEETKEIAAPLATESDSELSGDPLPTEATEKEGDIAPNLTAKDEDRGETVNSTFVAQDEDETAGTNLLENDNIEIESTERLIIGDAVGAQASADPPQNENISDPSEQSSQATSKETVAKAAISPALVKQLRDETGAGMMDCKKALSETGGDIVKAQEYLRKKGLSSADKKASRATAEGRIDSYIHDSRIGVLIEVNCETDFVARGDIFKELVEDLAMQVAACPQVQYLSTEDVPNEIVEKEIELESQKEDLMSKPEQFRSKIVDGRIRKRLEELSLLEQPFIKNDKVVVKDWVKQTISTIGENIKVKRFVRYNLGEGLEKKSQDFAAEVAAQTASKPVSTSVIQEPAADSQIKEKIEETPKVAVSAALVKQLREESGAGMMDCKKALSESGGDLEKAQEYLRKKGLSTADKKSSRLAAEGRIGSYIHDSRIGVLIEVNCETDFVGRSEKFKELVDDLAMQVVAYPQVQYVSIEDIPESIVNKEKELEMQRDDIQSKPESIREKIVDGRVSKRLGELALLEQPYIKNDSILVKDLVKQTVAALGENMKVRRFVRFTLGETGDAKVEN